jgi:fucose 4-O-acetylase-like acetyltransferase
LKIDDLSTLDRTTLWLWRSGNLVGWGLAGTVAALVGFVISVRILIAISPSQTVAFVTAFAVGGLSDGLVVGSRVYRSPRLVAGLSILVPAAVLTSALSISSDPRISWSEIAIGLGVPLAVSAVAALVAGVRFARRPRALRA